MRLTRLAAALATSALFAATLAVSTGGPAWAHNSLTDASPAKNARLEKAPESVRLTFLQRVDPDAVEVSVTGAAERTVAGEGPTASGRTATLTFGEPLPNGDYTVTYRVSSTDGHLVKGSYRFSVNDPAAEPAAAPAPVASASPSASASPAAPAPVAVSESTSTTYGWPVVAGVAVVLLVGAGALLLARRRRATDRNPL